MSENENPSLIKSIIYSQKKAIAQSSLLFLANSFLIFVPSILLLEIFKFLDDPNQPFYIGMLLSTGLLISKILEGVTSMFIIIIIIIIFLLYLFGDQLNVLIKK